MIRYLRNLFNAVSKRAMTVEEWLNRRFNGESSAGVSVTVARSLGLSALWCGIKVISEAVGMMPLHLYGSGGDVRVRATKHPLYTLLHDEPNPEMTRPVFFETLQSHCLLYGNGYAEIERANNGEPMALWPIHPTRVTVKRDELGQLYYSVNNGQFGTNDLAARDVIHVPGLGPDGSVGWQLLEYGRDTLGFALAAQQFGSSWFRNSGRPGGVIEVAGTLTEKARENMRLSWQKMHAGADNAGKVAVLEEGSTWKPMQGTHEQAQYKDLLLFFVYEVARLLNCPPSKLHSLEKASWGNLETLNQDFLTATLQPWLTKWEAELKRKLLPKNQRANYYPEFLADVIVRLNYQTRVDGLVKQTGGPILTVNEARALDNRPPIDGGNVLRNPTNIPQAPTNEQPPSTDTAKPGSGNPQPDGQSGTGNG